MQSQIAALFYASATLVTFIVMLMFTDMHFVWRSTVLSAEQIYPVLSFIATPWWFLESAQPSLELLKATQDSRLHGNYTGTAEFAQWWPFVLSVVIFYTCAIRLLLLMWGRLCLSRQLSGVGKTTPTMVPSRVELNDVPVNETSMVTAEPTSYYLANWGGFERALIATLPLQPNSVVPVNATTQLSDIPHKQGTQLLLVKSWEPPLGELSDYMQLGEGMVLPVDNREQVLCRPLATHLQEWQRFVKEHKGWELYQPEHWDQKETG